MPPKSKDTPNKGKGRAGAQDENTKDQINFGYPQPVVTPLQAIAARSTAGLFRDPVAVAADQSVQQLAQSQANALDKLGKRINGNLKAKLSLQEAATLWISKIGQHLAALTSRLSAVATRLDQDQSEAITALQQASVHLEASAQEQVTKALGGMGPVWSQAQETEVLRIAACMRAFSAVGGGDPAAVLPAALSEASGPAWHGSMAAGSTMMLGPSVAIGLFPLYSGQIVHCLRHGGFQPGCLRQAKMESTGQPSPSALQKPEARAEPVFGTLVQDGYRLNPPTDLIDLSTLPKRKSLFLRYLHPLTPGPLRGITFPGSVRSWARTMSDRLPPRIFRNRHFLCYT